MSLRASKGRLALVRDFQLLVILFISFRLMLLIVYQPMVSGGLERGVTAGGDFSYYYALAQLSDDGLYPYRDYWSEFPPIWPVLYTGIYRLMAVAGEPTYTGFAGLLGLVLLGFDTGCLLFVRRIGEVVHGPDIGLGLAWVYALLLAPAVFIWWNFEAVVAFFVLLAVCRLLEHRDVASALSAGVGGLVKFVPLVVLGAVWRFRPWKQAVRYTILALGVFGLVYVGLIVAYGEMVAASLVAQFAKSSYGTVWALLDGNYATGVFGPVAERFDAMNALKQTGNPGVVPSWLRLFIFGGFGLFAFLRTRRYDKKGLLAFVTLTLLVFFLYAQGWSPQWLALIIPLVLLNFPNRSGVLVVVLLSLISFAEYPLLFIRTGDTGGVITGALRLPFVTLVVSRTLILVGLVIALYQRLRLPLKLPAGAQS